jgi:hypothetical protein
MVCGVDNAFSLDDFKERFSIEVTSLGALRLPRRPAAAAAAARARPTLRAAHSARAAPPRARCAAARRAPPR